MRIHKIGMVSTFLVSLIVAAALFCGCGQARAAGEEDYFHYVIVNDQAYIIGYGGWGGDITIPSTLDGYPVTRIANMAFLQNDRIESVTIPEGVTSIGESAFESCWRLTSVNGCQGVTSIGDRAFYGSSLTSIILPQTLQSIGYGAFGGIDELDSITVDDNNLYYTSVGGVLYNKTGTSLLACPGGLASIDIPPIVTSIGDMAFLGNYYLTNVRMPPTLTNIGDSAFGGCASLTSISIPQGVTDIGAYTFQGCNSLARINLPSGLTSIGKSAFRFSGVINLILPSTLESIGDLAFLDCYYLTSITFKSATTVIYDSSYTIPAPATIIGYDPSTAKDYAEKYGRTFKLIGDVDPPTNIDIIVNPDPPIIDEETSFDGSGAEQVGKEIATYNWFFGDGSSATGLATPTTTHTYTDVGKYTVTLKVIYTDGSNSTYTKNIIVEQASLNLTANSFNFGNMGDKDTLKGPEINFLGKSFPIFAMPIEAKIEIADTLKVKYIADEDKYEVIIGDLGDDAEGYQAIKELVNQCGKTTDKDFYNAFRKIQKNLRAQDMGMGFKYKTYLAGYMEFTNVNGQYESTDGGLVFVAEADASVTYRLPSAPIVYLKVGVEGKFDGKVGLKYIEAGDIEAYGQLGLDVALYGGPGLGVDKIANVEAGFKGGIETEFEILFLSLEESFTAKMTGSVYLKVSILMFINGETTYRFAEKQLWPPPVTTQSLFIKPSDFELMPRNYSGGGRLTAQSLNELSLDELNSTVIKSGVFPYGEPQLLPLGSGKQLLIWVDDKTDRSLANRTALMYSVYDGSSWSSPAYVNDDGTADFAPRAAVDNGQVYLTWQNANTTFADTVTLEEMAQGIDLSYARFDGSSFTDITNLISAADTTLEMSPVIAVSGSEVTVAWIENSANDPFGLTGTYTIKTITASAGVWGEPQTLVSSLPLITSLDASYHNGAYILAYTVDMDGDIGTNSDTELFLINAAVPTRITTDAVDDSGVQIVDQGASSQIYWQSGDEIKYLSPDDNVVNTMSVTTQANQMRNLHILANDNGEQALVWEQSDGFKNELYGAYYDTSSSTWGGAVKLTALEGNIRQSSAYLDNDNTIQTAFDLAQVLEINETNSEPYGSTDLMVGSIGRDINLTIDGGVYYDPQLLQPNATINLSISVKNNSADTVTQLEADILDQADQILSTQSIATNITSGASQEIEIPYTLPAAIIKQDLKIQIRPSGVADIDMRDNQVTFTVGFADVALLSTEVLGGNTPNQIQVHIQNIGYDDALNIVAALQKDGADGEVLDTQSIANLAAGATQTLEFNLDPSWLEFASERDNKLFYISLTTESPEGQYGNNASLVVVSPPHVTDVSLSQTALELAVGSTAPLQATVNPSEAINKDMLWWSENEAVATVDENGTVTGLKAGQTTVYAVSFDGNKMAGCAVNVTGLTGCTLSGKVLVEGDDLTEGQTHYSGGVSIKLKQGEEIKYSATSSEAADLASNGTFSLAGITAGDYLVVISKAGYLTRSFALTINSDLTLSTTSNQYLNRIYLLAGDIVSDEFNVIAASDVNYILSKFNSNSTQVGFDPQVDIVKDQYNVISAADVNLMLSNFNKNSTQYLADIIY